MFTNKCNKCELEAYVKQFEKYRIDSMLFQMSAERVARIEKENEELKKILFEKCGEQREKGNE